MYVRLKECCRKALKDIDSRKKKGKFQSGILALKSLHDTLGEKPLDQARKALIGSAGGNGGSGEGETTRETCKRAPYRATAGFAVRWSSINVSSSIDRPSKR